MYVFLLGLHNITRWLVLLSGVAALVTAYWGMFSKREFGGIDKATGVTFTSLFGLQVILGLILYFVSPLYGVRGFGALDLAEGSTRVQIIFFSMYHITLMLLALVVAQLGYSRAKRAENPKQAFRRAALGYTVGIVLVFLAVPWGIRPNWRSPITLGPDLDTTGAQHLTLTVSGSGQFFNLEA